MRPRHAVLATAAFIAAFTLLPSSGAPFSIGFTCVLCGDRGVADLLLNVVLFLPLGAALWHAGVPPLRALLIGAAFAAAIELAQVLLPGRSPTLRDIVANGAGAWGGALLAMHLRRWVTETRGSVRRIWLALAIVLATVAATGWLLSPAPSAGDYFGQWAPSLRNFAQWGGLISDVHTGRTPIPGGPFGSADAEAAVRSGSNPLKIVGIAKERPTELAPIFAIADGQSRHLLIIGQEGDDLRLRTYRRSSMLRLDTPDIRFAHAMSHVGPGDSLAIEMFRPFSDAPCLSVNGDFSCARRWSAGSVWTVLLWKASLSGAPGRWLGALTLFLLVLPIGLLLRVVPRNHAVGAVAVLLIGLVVVPPTVGLATPGILESASVVAALAVGHFTMRPRTVAVR